jgi:hypothetical protein
MRPLHRALDTHSREQHWSAVFSSIEQHLNGKPQDSFFQGRGLDPRAPKKTAPAASPESPRAIGLFVPLQFPLSPFRVFAIGVEHALDRRYCDKFK